MSVGDVDGLNPAEGAALAAKIRGLVRRQPRALYTWDIPHRLGRGWTAWQILMMVYSLREAGIIRTVSDQDKRLTLA